MNDQAIDVTTVREPGRQAQHLVVFCAPDRKILTDMVDSFEHVLTFVGYEVRTLMYGITPKGHNGILVLYVEEGIPLDFQASLANDTRVLDYAVYDVSPDEHNIVYHQYEPEPEVNALPAPPAPTGYKLHSYPRPLYTSHDTYWIAWAWGKAEGAGLLLYDERGQQIAFFIEEEATTLLYTLLERAPSDLLPRCAPDYLKLHAPGIAFLRAHLWALQLEVMRRGVEHVRARRRKRHGEQESMRQLQEWLDERHLQLVFDEAQPNKFRLVSEDGQEVSQ